MYETKYSSLGRSVILTSLKISKNRKKIQIIQIRNSRWDISTDFQK